MRRFFSPLILFAFYFTTIEQHASAAGITLEPQAIATITKLEATVLEEEADEIYFKVADVRQLGGPNGSDPTSYWLFGTKKDETLKHVLSKSIFVGNAGKIKLELMEQDGADPDEHLGNLILEFKDGEFVTDSARMKAAVISSTFVVLTSGTTVRRLVLEFVADRKARYAMEIDVLEKTPGANVCVSVDWASEKTTKITDDEGLPGPDDASDEFYFKSDVRSIYPKVADPIDMGVQLPGGIDRYKVVAGANKWASVLGNPVSQPELAGAVILPGSSTYIDVDLTESDGQSYYVLRYDPIDGTPYRVRLTNHDDPLGTFHVQITLQEDAVGDWHIHHTWRPEPTSGCSIGKDFTTVGKATLKLSDTDQASLQCVGQRAEYNVIGTVKVLSGAQTCFGDR